MIRLDNGFTRLSWNVVRDKLIFLKEKTKKNIWLYTGYTLEQVREDELRRKCLEYVDVLVDGRFVKELYDPNLKFRGSSNQRIIKKEYFLKLYYEENNK